MSPMANRVLAMLEAMNKLNIEQSATVRMKGLLRRKLLAHFGSEDAEKIVSAMKSQSH